MAAFQLSLSMNIDISNYLVTLTDTSNWADNDEGYIKSDFVRTINITDPEGTVLFASPYTVPIGDSITFTSDKDRILLVTFTAEDEGESITITDDFSFILDLEYKKCYINKVNYTDCKCDCDNECNQLRKASNKYYAAVYNFTYSNFIQAQEHLDYANTLCSEDCDC